MMEHTHRGFGRINYDPHRGTMKRDTANWCVIELDREITRYYREWLKREKHIILQQPAWDAHISVVRGERIPQKYKDMWKKRQGQRVEFIYEHGDIQVSKDKDAPGWFHWIRVHCPTVDEIREELGLVTSWKTHHITIGRTYY